MDPHEVDLSTHLEPAATEIEGIEDGVGHTREE